MFDRKMDFPEHGSPHFGALKFQDSMPYVGGQWER